ncbi:hypothetical protein HBE96_04305 [Clostridium sp. P21]|uniref:C4-type zinc ribbon domain-containing protein n=1 Tax=Clostridium muellerianum TaxID=2716538 RepID=A0A7Y0HMT3_9CLOT|nr:C4-type zinc ribbon domain-containing protein [Clostridium muellerianum]NMM61922.1 hypothetical protein [Clostridium muellerianum]
MSLLQQLIEIQENKKVILECSNTIKNSQYTNNLKNLKKEFDLAKVQFKNKEDEITKVREKYQTVNNNINNDKKELEKIKFELYNDAGSDLKLIDVLQKQFDTKKDGLESLDNEGLKLLEVEEKLCAEKENLRIKLSNLKNDFYTYKSTESEKINVAKENLRKAEENIKSMEKLIPEDILEIFNKISSSKGTGAAELKDHVCLGCRVKVSSMTIDSVKREEKIVYCDNCGRIIYCNADSKK